MFTTIGFYILYIAYGGAVGGMLSLLIEPIIRNLDIGVDSWDYDQLYQDDAKFQEDWDSFKYKDRIVKG